MRFKLFILTFLSAVFFPLALPNELFLYGQPILGLFCLSFFFWAIYESPSYPFAALLGAVFGMVSTILANFWLSNFNEYAFYTLGGTTLGYTGANALLAPYLRAFSKLKQHLRPLLIAMLFSVYEYLKSTGFLAYPWGLIAYPVHSILPFIQFVDLTGIWGLSFLCSLFNTLTAELFYLKFSFCKWNLTFRVYRKNLYLKNQAVFALALIILATGYGICRLNWPYQTSKKVDALLIQQNIDPWDPGKALKGIQIARQETLRGISVAKQKLGKTPDLVIWSETALRYAIDPKIKNPFNESNALKYYFPELFKEFQTYTLTGAPVIGPIPGRYYNAAVLISPQGCIEDFYAKQHPVPFVESIPFIEINIIKNFFEKNLGLSNLWLMGKKANVLKLDLPDGQTLNFGVPICFEDVFADICREFVKNGAEILINISNDSWSATNSALTQHLAAARFRAIENRRVLLRGTNAGLTCVIGPNGEIINSIPLFEQNHLLAGVEVKGLGLTSFYTIFGDYLPYLFSFYLLALLCFSAFKNFFLKLFSKVKRPFTRKEIN